MSRFQICEREGCGQLAEVITWGICKESFLCRNHLLSLRGNSWALSEKILRRLKEEELGEITTMPETLQKAVDKKIESEIQRKREIEDICHDFMEKGHSEFLRNISEIKTVGKEAIEGSREIMANQAVSVLSRNRFVRHAANEMIYHKRNINCNEIFLKKIESIQLSESKLPFDGLQCRVSNLETEVSIMKKDFKTGKSESDRIDKMIQRKMTELVEFESQKRLRIEKESNEKLGKLKIENENLKQEKTRLQAESAYTKRDLDYVLSFLSKNVHNIKDRRIKELMKKIESDSSDSSSDDDSISPIPTLNSKKKPSLPIERKDEKVLMNLPKRIDSPDDSEDSSDSYSDSELEEDIPRLENKSESYELIEKSDKNESFTLSEISEIDEKKNEVQDITPKKILPPLLTDSDSSSDSSSESVEFHEVKTNIGDAPLNKVQDIKPKEKTLPITLDSDSSSDSSSDESIDIYQLKTINVDTPSSKEKKDSNPCSFCNQGYYLDMCNLNYQECEIPEKEIGIRNAENYQAPVKGTPKVNNCEDFTNLKQEPKQLKNYPKVPPSILTGCQFRNTGDRSPSADYMNQKDEEVKEGEKKPIVKCELNNYPKYDEMAEYEGCNKAKTYAKRNHLFSAEQPRHSEGINTVIELTLPYRRNTDFNKPVNISHLIKNCEEYSNATNPSIPMQRKWKCNFCFSPNELESCICKICSTSRSDKSY